MASSAETSCRWSTSRRRDLRTDQPSRIRWFVWKSSEVPSERASNSTSELPLVPSLEPTAEMPSEPSEPLSELSDPQPWSGSPFPAAANRR
jgi:hypothetical protein